MQLRRSLFRSFVQAVQSWARCLWRVLTSTATTAMTVNIVTRHRGQRLAQAKVIKKRVNLDSLRFRMCPTTFTTHQRPLSTKQYRNHQQGHNRSCRHHTRNDHPHNRPHQSDHNRNKATTRAQTTQGTYDSSDGLSTSRKSRYADDFEHDNALATSAHVEPARRA